MAKSAVDLINACGYSTPQTLSNLAGVGRPYNFPGDFTISSVDGITEVSSGPYYPGDTVEVYLGFSGNSSTFNNSIRENTSNYNLSFSNGNLSLQSQTSHSFYFNCDSTGYCTIYITFNNAFNTASGVGNQKSLQVNIQSANDAPNARISSTVVFNTAVDFDASNSGDPDGDSLEYRWDYTDNGSWDTGWSTSATTSYSYSSTNTSYRCTVQVRDGNGGYDQATEYFQTGGSGGSGSSSSISCSSPTSSLA